MQEAQLLQPWRQPKEGAEVTLRDPENSTEVLVQKNCGSTRGPHRFKPGNTLGFKPGVCPNPGGRPKQQSEVIQLARELSVDARVRSLHKIATRGKSERARIEAAVALLDRAFGRPKVQIENEGNPLTITAIRQIIVSPDGGETICPPIFGDSFVAEDAEVVEND